MSRTTRSKINEPYDGEMPWWADFLLLHPALALRHRDIYLTRDKASMIPSSFKKDSRRERRHGSSQAVREGRDPNREHHNYCDYF